MPAVESDTRALQPHTALQGRVKSLYSMYNKMMRKKIPMRQVYDARALRIIVDDEGGTRTADAWAAAYRCLTIIIATIIIVLTVVILMIVIKRIRVPPRALRIIVDDEGGTRTADAWAAAYRY